MKRFKVTAVVLASLMMASCSDATSSTTTSETESSVTTVETTEETTQETTQETASETSETTSETSEETTVAESSAETSPKVNGESVVYEMKHAELDENGNLPDGSYLAYEYNIHSTGEDGWFNVYSYFYLDAEDVAKLKVGDKLHTDSEKDIEVEQITDEEGDSWHYIRLTEYCWFLKEQGDGRYYLDDGTDYTYNCRIASDMKLSFAPDVVIYDGADVYTKNGVKINEYSVKYDTVADLYADLKSDKAFSEPALQIVVKDGLITELYVNPALHEGWIER